jgi:hypothetical protein
MGAALQSKGLKGFFYAFINLCTNFKEIEA